MKIRIFRLLSFSENRAFYDIMWKKYCREKEAIYDNIIRRMRFA